VRTRAPRRVPVLRIQPVSFRFWALQSTFGNPSTSGILLRKHALRSIRRACLTLKRSWA